MDGMRTTDVRDTGLGKPEKSYLALLDKISYCAGHFLDRHVRINAMLIEEIDMVGIEPLQGVLNPLANMLGPAGSFGADLFAVLETKTEFGGDHHLVAPALERSTEQCFVGQWAIDLGCIE
jgi:hypothetical protein